MLIMFSDLCDKEVVNVCDGTVLGFVSDAEFDTECGRILRLTVPLKCGLFTKKSNAYIRWDCIERIGEDVILVRHPQLPQKDR
ncbi:MAG: YlmC/YmxH family sporulation protein [Eubacteriales bacterium]